MTQNTSVKKGVASALLAFLVAGLTLVAMPKLALAASCASGPSKANCDYKDPIAEGCTDGRDAGPAYGIYDGSRQVGIVQLRWSEKCKSNWAKVTSYIGAVYLEGKTIRQEDNVVVGVKIGPYTSVYTSMVYGYNKPVQAFGAVQVRPGDSGWVSNRTPFF